MLVAAVFANMVVMEAHAFMAPDPGSFMYFLYDFFVNSIIRGPVGFVCGILCIAMGARQLIHYNYAAPGPPHYGLSAWVPVSCFVWWLVAAFLLDADNMMVSLGTII